MSYCRWSSLSWRCDLYVYESGMGIEIHVAGRRRMIPEGWEYRFGDPESQAELDSFLIARIDHPEAGAWRTFDLDDAESACEWIDQLASQGFTVPDDLCDALRSDFPEATP